MSEGDVRPWGEGDPPHGWVCRICGKVILENSRCTVDLLGVHQRSIEATSRWHRVIEEVAAVSAAHAEGSKTFYVTLNLDAGLFAGDYRDRDSEIAAIMRAISTRLVVGQYTADDPNNLATFEGEVVGSFQFVEAP